MERGRGGIRRKGSNRVRRSWGDRKSKEAGKVKKDKCMERDGVIHCKVAK